MLWLVCLLFACGGDATPPETAPDPVIEQPTPAVAVALSDAQAPERPEALTADQCDSVEGGAPPDGPGCLSGTLTCGQTTVGHTLGGGNHFTSQFYDKKHCTPATTNHDGGDERVYRLDIPEGDRRVTIHLDTPCADLDLAAMRWSGEDCPTIDDAIRACDMWPKPDNKAEKVTIVSREAATYFVVVEGKDEQEGAFSLTVDCTDGLY